MDNLRSVIELLFLERDVNDLILNLNTRIGRDNDKIIDRETFKKLYASLERRYSGNQLNSLFDITNDKWSHNGILQTDEQIPSSCRNVFNVLSNLTSQLLVTSGGKPYCRYEEYLRWNEVSRNVGEDILVTNYLASADFKDNYTRTSFAWEPFILTTNQELRGVVSNGLAELHNHLKGSSMIFTLTWLALMNYPTFADCPSLFTKLTTFAGGYKFVQIAAVLRLWLYLQIENGDNCVFQRRFERWLTESDKISFLWIVLPSAHNRICSLRNSTVFRGIDYAITPALIANTQDIDSRRCLVGERNLLYRCFNKMQIGANLQFEKVLYLYLIIKSQFRYSILQLDDTIGFENFQHYDELKTLFLKHLNNGGVNKYIKILPEIGIKMPKQDSSVRHIEYRVAPEESASALLREIKKTDAFANAEDSHGYIVHFIKKQDNPKFYTNNIENSLRSRNQTVRNEIRKNANDIRLLLKNGNQLIVGIDAANSEFYCRPEVFGTVYRRLRHTFRRTDLCRLMNMPPLHLGFTFHVGEDFYDVIDGLRAIEEAQIFLNLRNGDRIGHGTALGIDVYHYYEEKHFTVVMPKQVLFDNVVWLLNKVEQYGITDESGFIHTIKGLFYKLRHQIYPVPNNMSEDELQTFVNAWLLRGDEPSLYRNYTSIPTRSSLMDIYQINCDRRVEPIRVDNRARYLYYRYHYDYKGKSNGSKSIEWKIEACYRQSFVRILETIQNKMQDEIANKHIAIECNPTSNLRIGNIPKYIDHPIVRFYNEGLVCNYGELTHSAQISVSINTDDAGIFATSLEKEFTLMALALEKERDENGELKYNQRSVYRWLENVRENAFIHKF